MKLKCIGLFFLLILTCGVLEAASPKVILVFPLENMSGNASLGWMSEGIAELLATRLASPTRYVVRRSERETAYEELGLPSETSLTLASEYKAARLLGANIGVVGRFTLVGDQLTTHVQWLNIAGLKLSHSVTVTGKLTDLDALETRLAWKLLKSQDKGAVIGTEEEFGYRFPPVRLDAFESYIRGILSTDTKSRIHFLQESDRLNPRDHRAAFVLGRYYFDQGDYADSARWLQILDSGDRDYAESRFLLGTDDYFLGHDASAENAFKKLAALIPLSEVLNNLGAVELRLGHSDDALADFKEAFQRQQDDTDYAYNMSIALWHMKKYSQAEECLRKMLTQDPDDEDAHALLAQVAGELGDAEARQDQLAWVSDHDPDAAKDSEDDHGSAKPAFQPSPRIKTEYDAKAFHLLTLARIRAAQKRISQESAPVVQSEGQACLKRGLDLLSVGRLSEAEQELTQAALLLPRNSEAHRALGEAYQREGKQTLAATELQTSLQEKDSLQAHLWLARTYVSLEHLDAALRQAQAAVELDPHNAAAQDLVKQIRSQLSVHRDKP